MKKLLCVVAAVLFTSPVFAAGGGGELKHAEWSFDVNVRWTVNRLYLMKH